MLSNKRLRALRHLAGKSQEILAFEANVSQAKLSRVERGIYEFSKEEKERVAQVLGCKAEEIFI